MPETPEIKRRARFWRTIEVIAYKKAWACIPNPEQTERMLIRGIPVREVDSPNVIHKNVVRDFVDISVHGWVDMIADGIAFEIKTSSQEEARPFFISRSTLQKNYMDRPTDSRAIPTVLASTLRGVWLAEAEAFIPPNPEVFFRRIPLEELNGFRVLVWGAKSCEAPTKTDILRSAMESSSLHVKLYGRFLAV